MHLYDTRLAGGVIWGMIGLALWSGLPSVGCVCANGGYKLFCDAHQPARHGSSLPLPGEFTSDCCFTSQSSVRADCCHRTATDPSMVTGPGCTRITSTPAAAQLPQTTRATPDETVACYAPMVELPHVPAAYADVPLVRPDTGPPGDRVIALHCLLI